MEGEYQRSACAMVGGKEDTERRRGRRQKCKGGEGKNNLKAMDLECIRGESVGCVGEKEECLNALPQNSPCLSFPSLQLRLGKPSSATGRKSCPQPKIEFWQRNQPCCLPRLTPAESRRLGFSFTVCIYSRYFGGRCPESGTSPFLQHFPRVCHQLKGN